MSKIVTNCMRCNGRATISCPECTGMLAAHYVMYDKICRVCQGIREVGCPACLGSGSVIRYSSLDERERNFDFDVFLSYARGDEDHAKQLYEKLKGSEVRTYFAPKELFGGDPFNEEIRRSLINSFEIWVLTTPNSLKSEWVATEWAAAWVLKKRIVPILLRCNVDALPERLKSFQLVDYHEVDSLITQLKTRLVSDNSNS